VSEGYVFEFSVQLGTSIFGVEMREDRLLTSYRLVRGRRGYSQACANRKSKQEM